jgi:hypothetical protein
VLPAIDATPALILRHPIFGDWFDFCVSAGAGASIEARRCDRLRDGNPDGNAGTPQHA